MRNRHSTRWLGILLTLSVLLLPLRLQAFAEAAASAPLELRGFHQTHCAAEANLNFAISNAHQAGFRLVDVTDMTVSWDRARLTLNDATLPAPCDEWEGSLTKGKADSYAYFGITGKSPKSPGLYLVDVAGKGPAGEGSDRHLLAVSDLIVAAKMSRNQLLIYVTDRESQAPVAGADIRVGYGTLEWETYEGEGAQRRRVIRQEPHYAAPIATGATDAEGVFLHPFDALQSPVSGKSLVNVHVQVRQGRNYSIVDVPVNPLSNRITTYGFTDRSVYRPGDTVHIKAVVRETRPEVYAPHAGQSVALTVFDADRNPVSMQPLTTDEFGSVLADFQLADEPTLGSYSCSLRIGDTDYAAGHFKVEAYRKPPYRLDVAIPEDAVFVAGDTVSGTLHLGYQFGKPVAGGSVECRFGDYQATLTTDGAGNASFDIPTIARQTYPAAITWQFTDKTGQIVTQSSPIAIFTTMFTLDIPRLKTTPIAGKPASIPFTATYVRKNPEITEVFAALSRQDPQTSEWKILTSGLVKTAADGAGAYAFTPGTEGQYRLTLQAIDARGNRIEQSTTLWIYAESPKPDEARFLAATLLTEKPVLGGTAEFRLRSTEIGAHALVTIEGLNLYRHQLIRIDARESVFTLPIDESWAPECKVSFILAGKFGQRLDQHVPVAVPASHTLLNLEITRERESFAPRDAARFHLKVTDAAGAPVMAELTAALVDESIFQIAPDASGSIHGAFYSHRPHAVAQASSWSAYHLNLAYVLTKDGLYLERSDYDELASFTSELFQEQERSIGGGAGGTFGGRMGGKANLVRRGGGGMAQAGDPVRGYFPDTALWQGTLLTDEKGEAVITTELPDSITTWRLTARAQTRDSRFAQGTTTVIVSKTLFAQPILPRFVTAGDRFEARVLVHNYGADSIHAELTAALDGGELRGTERQTVDAAPSATALAAFPVTAGSDATTLQLRFDCRAGDLTDAVVLSIPVLDFSIEERAVAAAVVTGSSQNVNLDLPASFDAVNAEIEISATTDLTETLFQGLQYLMDYPYGCAEQTTNRFLPAVIAAAALREAGMEGSLLDRRLDAIVNASLQRLYGMQNSDGSWGWWRECRPSHYLTAHVVHGMAIAQSLGYTVSSRALNRGIASLREFGQLNDNADEQAYILHALSFTDEDIGASLDICFQRREQLSPIGKALLGIALNHAGKTEESALLAREISRLAVRNAGQTLLLQPAGGDGWLGNDTEATAYALRLLLVNGMDGDAQALAHTLLARRRGQHWDSSKDTAEALIALTEYSRRLSQGRLPASLRATVNGHEHTLSVEPRGTTRLRVDASTLQTGANTVTFASDSGAAVYCDIQARWRVNGATAAPQGQRLGVTRRYYRLQSVKDPVSGVMTTESEALEGSVATGDLLRVELIVTAAQAAEYVMLRDPLPTGCSYQNDSVPHVGRQIFDKEAVFFLESLPAGEHRIAYHVIAETPGEFSILPAAGAAMYSPDIHGHGAGATLKIVDE